jgi:hypothetical protein
MADDRANDRSRLRAVPVERPWCLHRRSRVRAEGQRGNFTGGGGRRALPSRIQATSSCLSSRTARRVPAALSYASRGDDHQQLRSVAIGGAGWSLSLLHARPTRSASSTLYLTWANLRCRLRSTRRFSFSIHPIFCNSFIHTRREILIDAG